MADKQPADGSVLFHPMYRKRFESGRLYESAKDEKCLHQGDLISRDEFVSELVPHLPYFAEKKYFVAFCVVTQTCDLVLDLEQNRKPVDFINMAVVRPIDHAFSELHRHVPSGNVVKKLTPILNHNWNPRAYFYLYPNVDARINEDCVVDLRVLFTVSDNHYDQLVAARTGAMMPGYAAQLGWMAGNVFSRVATTDWNDLPQLPHESDDSRFASATADDDEWKMKRVVDYAGNVKERLKTNREQRDQKLAKYLKALSEDERTALEAQAIETAPLGMRNQYEKLLSDDKESQANECRNLMIRHFVLENTTG